MDCEEEDRHRNRDKSRSRIVKYRARSINKGNTSTHRCYSKNKEKAKVNSKHVANLPAKH